jgi:hypothetical protein
MCIYTEVFKAVLMKIQVFHRVAACCLVNTGLFDHEDEGTILN